MLALLVGENRPMTDQTDATSERVGPIIFAHETAREQLTTAGSVVTFRRNHRTGGETWWRASRTGPKQGDVTVTELRSVSLTADALRPYRAESGFESVTAWKEAIRELNGRLPDSGYLYRATKHSAQDGASDR
jgi:hypothetical protein